MNVEVDLLVSHFSVGFNVTTVLAVEGKHALSIKSKLFLIVVKPGRT
jgi:hypothetical protein